MAPERFEMKSSTLKEFYEEAPAAPQPDDSAVPSVPAEPEGPAGAEAPPGPAAPLPPVRTVPSAIPATSGSPSTGGAPAAPPSQGAPPWAPWMAAVGAIAMLIGPFAGMLWLLRRDGTPGHTD